MNTFIVEMSKLTLAGVSIRTSNADEAGPSRKLPQLWGTYFSSGVAAKPYNVNPHFIYGLYTDYESDASGAYTTLIGHEVGEGTAEQEIDGTIAIVPESKYLVFTTKKGPVQEVVAEMWGVIWAYFKDAVEVRAFTGDFERYDGRNFDPANTEVEIYIAIK
ncbi:AraC family transcriptional regulator [Paenibacillus sp. GSMTC-2017]|uniref:GyrI-like domain-containing protein n=1 Tax=Paenibacillus sp. GSMTC-2017 TaxID=2794350 RepID=UPI0018D716CD|nr:GyrI-like domain-containing protein [Paenibacillus sp. GSMTC-2017]MBH5319606.1 AraC family transcriptional regulator [Paenibacillus sp. GSMTC-2017]